MQRNFISAAGPLVLVLFAGCLSRAPKAPTHWTVTPVRTAVKAAQTPKYGVVRVSQVNVRAPYDGLKVAVLRPDGTIAFDSFNDFAATPSALLRGVAQDVVAASGLFERTVHPTSAALAPYALEVTVTRLALDCTRKDTRLAATDISVVLLKGRDIVAVASGSGTAPTTDGNFSAAFSAAVTTALSEALTKL